MEGDKTTVLPLAPTPDLKKKREFRFKRVSEGAAEEREREQERHLLCFYFDDSFLFRSPVMPVESVGGGGGGSAKVAALNELF